MKTKTFIINKISVNRKTIDTVKVSYHVYESHPDIKMMSTCTRCRIRWAGV